VDFIKVDGNNLILSIELSECSNCHKPMLKWHETIPEYLMIKLKSANVSKEVYGDFGICKTCVKERDFPRECICCSKNKMFPSEFEYQLTEYAKYPEDETDFTYICKSCTKNNPKEVMDLLVEADDASKVEGRKNASKT
jgi:hypothetical protein